jgi:hypothetical protein
MHARTQAAIIALIESLANFNPKIKGKIQVKHSKNKKTTIDLSFDRRKFIGRMQVVFQDGKFLVHLADKTEGRVASSDKPSSKSAYLEIATRSDAVKFVKMYTLLVQLAALGKPY